MMKSEQVGDRLVISMFAGTRDCVFKSP